MAKPEGIYENRSASGFSVKHERHTIHFDGYGELDSLQYLSSEQANSPAILTLINNDILKIALKSTDWDKIYDKIETRSDNMHSSAEEVYKSMDKVAAELQTLENNINILKIRTKRYLAWKHMLEWAYNYMTGV